MKILHVGKYYYPNQGGVETVLRASAEGLVQAGHDVHVLCFGRTPRDEHHVIDGVRITRTGILGTVLSQPLSPSLRRRMQELAASADVIHVHTPNPLAEYAALKLPKDKPIVATYHADVVRQRIVLPAYRPLIRKFLDRCASVAVATEKHVEYSPILAPFAAKCQVVPFGLEADRFAATARVRRLAASLRERHGDFVLFVGRLVGYKGLPYLIEAMRGLDRDLVIVGDGPLRGKLERLAAHHGLADRIHFVGALPEDRDVVAYYHACRLVALPSTTPAEAFGMVLMEAMACSKPLVTSRLRSGVVHVNQHAVNGLCAEPANPESLHTALAYLLRDDDLAAELGANGRRRFETEFTTDIMVARLEQLYAGVTVLPAGPQPVPPAATTPGRTPGSLPIHSSVS